MIQTGINQFCGQTMMLAFCQNKTEVSGAGRDTQHSQMYKYSVSPGKDSFYIIESLITQFRVSWLVRFNLLSKLMSLVHMYTDLCADQNLGQGFIVFALGAQQGL